SELLPTDNTTESLKIRSEYSDLFYQVCVCVADALWNSVSIGEAGGVLAAPGFGAGAAGAAGAAGWGCGAICLVSTSGTESRSLPAGAAVGATVCVPRSSVTLMRRLRGLSGSFGNSNSLSANPTTRATRCGSTRLAPRKRRTALARSEESSQL